jgi:hypothetical protein
VSELRRGHFLIGVGSDVVETGTNFETCHKLVWNGTGWFPEHDCGLLTATGLPTVVDIGSGRKRVIWELTPSGTSYGVQMRQRSYDGANGDYVMIEARLENTTASLLTLDMGLWLDWGHRDTTSSKVMTLSNRVAYVKNAVLANTGTKYTGTVFFGTHAGHITSLKVTGAIDKAWVLSALSGAKNDTDGGTSRNGRLIHGVRGVSIAGGRAKSVWLAMVGGNTLAELEANANAAAAEFTTRTGLPAF